MATRPSRPILPPAKSLSSCASRIRRPCSRCQKARSVAWRSVVSSQFCTALCISQSILNLRSGTCYCSLRLPLLVLLVTHCSIRHPHSRASSIMAMSGIVVLDSKNGCRAFMKRGIELGMSEFQRCRSSRSGMYKRYNIAFDLGPGGVNLMLKGLWKLRVRELRKICYCVHTHHRRRV
jgi:hypothetical protein